MPLLGWSMTDTITAETVGTVVDLGRPKQINWAGAVNAETALAIVCGRGCSTRLQKLCVSVVR